MTLGQFLLKVVSKYPPSVTHDLKLHFIATVRFFPLKHVMHQGTPLHLSNFWFSSSIFSFSLFLFRKFLFNKLPSVLFGNEVLRWKSASGNLTLIGSILVTIENSQRSQLLSRSICLNPKHNLVWHRDTEAGYSMMILTTKQKIWSWILWPTS